MTNDEIEEELIERLSDEFMELLKSEGLTPDEMWAVLRRTRDPDSMKYTKANYHQKRRSAFKLTSAKGKSDDQ